MKKYILKNYKLLDDFQFDLNKINVIIGENSSGKSSLLRSFQLLKQTSNSSYGSLILNSKKGLDFGNYSTLMTNSSNHCISFGIEFQDSLKSYGNILIKKVMWTYCDKKISDIEIYLKNNRKEKTLSIKLDKDNRVLSIKIGDIEINSLKNTLMKYNENLFPNFDSEIDDLNRDFLPLRFMACCEKDKIDTESSDIFNFLMDNLELSLNLNLEFVIKGKKIQGEKNIEYENYLNINFKKYEIVYMLNKFLININSKLNRTFNNISYTGAIRALGERYYRIEDDSSISETINNDISKKLFSLYKNNKLEKFNNFIHQHLNFEIEIKTLDSDEEEIFYFINIKGKDEISKNLVDVGAGYSQILPILFACFEKDKNPEAIIIIEQPELHLHPKMQSDLIDLFLKISNSNPELKLIIETHSNIIVDRIGKNIYKNNYDANNVNLLIFNKNDKLEIIQTKYDKEGTIEKWPARFFSAKDIEKWPPSSLKVEIPQKIRKILFSK